MNSGPCQWNLKEKTRIGILLVCCERDHDVSCYASLPVLNGEQ